MHRQSGRPRRGLHRAQAAREEGAAVVRLTPGGKGNKKERSRRYFKLRARPSSAFAIRARASSACGTVSSPLWRNRDGARSASTPCCRAAPRMGPAPGGRPRDSRGLERALRASSAGSSCDASKTRRTVSFIAVLCHFDISLSVYTASMRPPECALSPDILLCPILAPRPRREGSSRSARLS